MILHPFIHSSSPLSQTCTINERYGLLIFECWNDLPHYEHRKQNFIFLSNKAAKNAPPSVNRCVGRKTMSQKESYVWICSIYFRERYIKITFSVDYVNRKHCSSVWCMQPEGSLRRGKWAWPWSKSVHTPLWWAELMLSEGDQENLNFLQQIPEETFPWEWWKKLGYKEVTSWRKKGTTNFLYKTTFQKEIPEEERQNHEDLRIDYVKKSYARQRERKCWLLESWQPHIINTLRNIHKHLRQVVCSPPFPQRFPVSTLMCFRANVVFIHPYEGLMWMYFSLPCPLLFN